MAEDVETEMMLSKRCRQIGSGLKTRRKPETYSCASLTSPVIAVRPIYGFDGRDISCKVKQLLHCSPF